VANRKRQSSPELLMVRDKMKNELTALLTDIVNQQNVTGDGIKKYVDIKTENRQVNRSTYSAVTRLSELHVLRAGYSRRIVQSRFERAQLT